MYIANNNNCWFTNVGEAFIDIGVENIFKNIMRKNSEIEYGTITPMSKYYIGKCDSDKAISPEKWFYPDLLILAGMYATESVACSKGGIRDMVMQMKANGTKVAFLGMGGNKYNEEEQRTVVEMFDEMRPEFVITRDKQTYDLYKNFVNCKRGLDCAFWLDDDFKPGKMKHNSYICSTFNRSDEPKVLLDLENLIHPWHMQDALSKNRTKYLNKENLMISDSPYDYLTLYANADRVYTDLVHATIPCLVYETPVKYYWIDNRSEAFYSVSYIKIDNDGFLSIDKEMLRREKKEIEKFIENSIKVM